MLRLIGSAQGEVVMLKRPKIVAIVEDDPGMLVATEHLLNAHGLVTLRYASAEEFLVSGSESQVDCLLLDISLRGMSGVELSRTLKIAGQALPTIFITALEDEKVHQKALQEGVACLHKPFPAAELIDAIEKAVP
jgi:FixJ family two-component response regulator